MNVILIHFCKNIFLTVLVVPQGDDNKCGIMTSDVDTDHGEGFVCGKPIFPDFEATGLY